MTVSNKEVLEAREAIRFYSKAFDEFLKEIKHLKMMLPEGQVVVPYFMMKLIDELGLEHLRGTPKIGGGQDE